MLDKKTGRNDRFFSTGAVLFEENDESTDMYVIKSGKVEVFINRLNKEIVLGHLERGDVLGEMALFDSRPRSASARVVDDVTATVINHDMFDKRMDNIPEWMLTIIRILIHRLRDADKKIGETAVREEIFNTITIMSYILGKVKQGSKGEDIALIRQEIIEIFAIDEKMFVRVLDKLRLKGLLKFDKGLICEVNMPLLQKYVQFMKGTVDAEQRIDIEMSDEAFEFLTMLIWLSKRKGQKRDEMMVVSIDFKHSDTEKMLREFVDNETVDELVTLGILEVEQDAATYGRKMDVVFDANRIEKVLEFKKMVRLFAWQY